MAKLTQRQKEIRAKAIELAASDPQNGTHDFVDLLKSEHKIDKAAAITPKMIGDYTKSLLENRRLSTLYNLQYWVKDVPKHAAAYQKASKDVVMFHAGAGRYKFHAQVIFAFDKAAKAEVMPIMCEYSFPPHHTKQGSPKDIYNWLSGSELFMGYYPSAAFDFTRLLSKIASDEWQGPVAESASKMARELDAIPA